MPEDSESPKKIVWAVDAFSDAGSSQQHAVEAIRCLQSLGKVRGSVKVQPIHILSPAELNLSPEFIGPWVEEYRPAVQKALDQLIVGLDLEGIEKPRILTQGAASTRKAADQLAEFAQQIGADMILVSSHGRTGMSRLLLGSFAETLLLRSVVPVMVVGPQTQNVCHLEQLLFPTDFGSQSKNTFKRVVALAREYGAQLTLYHAISRPVEPVFQSGVYLLGSPWIPVQEYYNREFARRERHAQGWARWARHQGVETEVVIDTETTNIADAIVRLARDRGIGWISMAAHNGPIASALLGSVTRQVVRLAPCPVWVLRSPRSVWVRRVRGARAA